MKILPLISLVIVLSTCWNLVKALPDLNNSLQFTQNEWKSFNSKSVFLQNLKRLHREPPIHTKTRENVPIRTETITQKLDNFDESVKETWQMRYMINDHYFEEGGPILIFVGGEWEISPAKLQNGLIVDIAEEYGGVLFYTEHRFYGESKPTKDLKTDNLKYLHVTQSLADLAEFIRYQKREHPKYEDSKVILMGCSYSASMVVWFQRMFPDLIDGAWGSSGPLNAKLNFIEYKQVAGKAVKELGGQACYDRIQRGFQKLEEMVANRRDVAEVKAMFKLCDTFDANSDLDAWSFLDSLGELFAGIIQYQSGNDVGQMCNHLMKYEDDLDALSHFWFKNTHFSEGCLDVTYINSRKELKNPAYSIMRAWIYQTCNEYGWYQVTAAPDHPFGKSVPYYLYTTLCADVYGKQFTNKFMEEQIEQTNKKFGGFRPNVRNIHVSYGGLDPWHPMGMNARQGAVIISKTSHCQDFGSIDVQNDSKEMLEAKDKLLEAVRGWLMD